MILNQLNKNCRKAIIELAYGDQEGNINMKYRKKPVEVEAIQWTGDNWEEIKNFAKNSGIAKCLHSKYEEDRSGLIMPYSPDQSYQINLKDWIIKEVTERFYPCTKNIFEKTYEKVEDKL